jgi:hypothetical protein
LLPWDQLQVQMSKGRSSRGVLRYFRWVLHEADLDPVLCLKVNAGIGALAMLSAVAFLSAGRGDAPLPVPYEVAYFQLAFGALFLFGWPIGSKSEAPKRILVLQGFVLLLLLVLYQIFMLHVLGWFSTSTEPGSSFRVGHAPGILALGLAYAVRLLIDFGASTPWRSSPFARKIPLIAMTVGAALDLVLLFAFLSMPLGEV